MKVVPPIDAGPDTQAYRAGLVQRVHEAWEGTGLTFVQLAERAASLGLPVTVNMLASYQCTSPKAQRLPSAEILVTALPRIYGVRGEWLVSGQGPIQPRNPEPLVRNYLEKLHGRIRLAHDYSRLHHADVDEIAGLAGLKVTTRRVQNYLLLTSRGRHTPPVDILFELAWLYEVRFSWLVAGIGSRMRPP